MADEQEKAAADIPADPTAEELDLEAMGLEDVELTEEEQVAIAAAGARPARKTVVAEAVGGKGRSTPKRRRSCGRLSGRPPASYSSTSSLYWCSS